MCISWEVTLGLQTNCSCLLTNEARWPAWASRTGGGRRPPYTGHSVSTKHRLQTFSPSICYSDLLVTKYAVSKSAAAGRIMLLLVGNIFASTQSNKTSEMEMVPELKSVAELGFWLLCLWRRHFVFFTFPKCFVFVFEQSLNVIMS